MWTGGWITGADFLEYISGRSYWDDPWGTIVACHRKLGVDLFPGEVHGAFSPDELFPQSKPKIPRFCNYVTSLPVA